MIMNDDLRRVPETIRLSQRTHAIPLAEHHPGAGDQGWCSCSWRSSTARPCGWRCLPTWVQTCWCGQRFCALLRGSKTGGISSFLIPSAPMRRWFAVFLLVFLPPVLVGGGRLLPARVRQRSALWSSRTQACRRRRCQGRQEGAFGHRRGLPSATPVASVLTGVFDVMPRESDSAALGAALPSPSAGRSPLNAQTGSLPPDRRERIPLPSHPRGARAPIRLIGGVPPIPIVFHSLENRMPSNKPCACADLRARPCWPGRRKPKPAMAVIPPP